MKYAVRLFLVLNCIFFSCKEQESLTDIDWKNKFNDEELRKIYHYKDQRDSQQLSQYLSNINSEYREEAAFAYGSVQDTSVIKDLGSLVINDTSLAVKNAAAFSLGQTRSDLALPYIISAIEDINEPKVISTTLKAYGKCAYTEESLNYLAEVLERLPDEKEPLMWAYYYAGLNDNLSELGDKLAIDIIKNSLDIPERIAASNYLSRFRKRDFSAYQKDIDKAIVNESNPYVKSSLIKSLIGVTSDDLLNFLQNVLADPDCDYRAYISILKVMEGYSYPKVNTFFWEALNHPHQAVNITASNYLKNNVPKSEIRQLIDAAKKQQKGRAKEDLLIRCKEIASMKEVDDYLLEQLAGETNNYKIARLLQAEAADRFSIPLLQKLILTDTASIITTTAFEGLLNQLKKEDFIAYLESDSLAKSNFVKSFKEAMLTGDVALVYLGALALRDENMPLKSYIEDYEFLKEALNTLELPLKIEAWIELNKTIYYIEGKEEPINHIPEHIGTINWSMLHDISKDEKVLINTSKGDILIELMVESTPGTVAMFVELLKDQFYNGKYFHRNVPDFVIQGGCPRGDGFGGLPETIRSEFSYQEYIEEGMVGIASAGKDTESCQFFITHSPAPHLNGRYTIFAKVKDGMEVVHQLEVGDQILHIDRVVSE
ncbi:peptidylprolyl isomerase [Chondrinema litorale]|uniref:peptidylprolyl isomerase n=1 Tax=Chondrinema litorale TaxID=2994555 RepID=UPI0025438137|nr:peptidylprolyl isomerase [Chondrinema litorale]UZR93997.1 peptidylprolyl isomerase [Chondrinema litorale]